MGGLSMMRSATTVGVVTIQEEKRREEVNRDSNRREEGGRKEESGRRGDNKRDKWTGDNWKEVPREKEKPKAKEAPAIEEKELQAVAKEDTKDAGASKTMRYSDRRKEERARREKEKLEKLKKKEGGVSTDVLEEKELDKVTDGIQKIDIDEKETNNSGKSDKEVIDLTTSDSKRKEERMGQRSGGRRGQSDIHPVQDRREDIEDGNKQKDERGQLSVTVTKDGRKVRNKERPAIQIYRPGMGKYSSKTIKKEEESPGPSPEESRESSPTKTKGSRSGSNEDQRR